MSNSIFVLREDFVIFFCMLSYEQERNSVLVTGIFPTLWLISRVILARCHPVYSSKHHLQLQYGKQNLGLKQFIRPNYIMRGLRVGTTNKTKNTKPNQTPTQRRTDELSRYVTTSSGQKWKKPKTKTQPSQTETHTHQNKQTNKKSPAKQTKQKPNRTKKNKTKPNRLQPFELSFPILLFT